MRLVLPVLTAGLIVFTAWSQGPPLKTELVADGFSNPLFLTAPPGDTERLFVLEQNTARIRIIKSGEILPEPFLDIGERAGQNGERGLLGLAFHPDYAANRIFAVNYTNNDGDTHISKFTTFANNPERADPDSEVILLFVDQPFANHNGGMVAFGPNDGHLYIGMGDGGSAGDPGQRAQNLQTLLGKMLRVHVAGDTLTIPPDNPFVADENALDEIWAYGLRNPWRFSFDRATGDMYIGDVGQGAIEEIDFQPASGAGGENYGWDLFEGSNPFEGEDPAGLVFPIHEYGRSIGRSVTGGYVYRGRRMPSLHGVYFFADYVSARVFSFRYDGQTLTDLTEHTAELAPPAGKAFRNISSFGEDANGEIYIVDHTGPIYKIVPNTRPEDINADGETNAMDVQIVINGALDIDTQGLPADVNGDGVVNSVDVQLVILAALE